MQTDINMQTMLYYKYNGAISSRELVIKVFKEKPLSDLAERMEAWKLITEHQPSNWIEEVTAIESLQVSSPPIGEASGGCED